MTIQEARDLLRRHLGEGVKFKKDKQGVGVCLEDFELEPNRPGYLRITTEAGQVHQIHEFGGQAEYRDRRERGLFPPPDDHIPSPGDNLVHDTVPGFLRSLLERRQSQLVAHGGAVVQLNVTILPTEDLREPEAQFDLAVECGDDHVLHAAYATTDPAGLAMALGIFTGTTPGGIVLDWLADRSTEVSNLLDRVGGQ